MGHATVAALSSCVHARHVLKTCFTCEVVAHVAWVKLLKKGTLRDKIEKGRTFKLARIQICADTNTDMLVN